MENLRIGLSENNYVMSENVYNEILEEIGKINYYPDPQCETLTRSLARKLSLKKEQIHIGNGLDEVILTIMLGLNIYRGRIMIPQHTFLGYFFSSKIIQGDIVQIPLKNFCVDIEFMEEQIDSSYDMIFLCNPHNPFGTVRRKQELYNIIKKCNLLNVYVVVDEAYIEFLLDSIEVDVTNWINEFDNLIVLRTFSKAYGLAGLRCGYACASEKIIKEMRTIHNALPFRVNRIVQRAAIAALKDEQHLRYIVSKNYEDMNWLKTQLNDIGVKYVDSKTNFVSFYLENASEFTKILQCKHNIMVKNLDSMRLCNWVRISSASREKFNVFLQELRRIVNNDDC